MFCPECGEVIGAGPLDLRCAGRGERRGVAERLGRWIGAIFFRVAEPRPARRSAIVRRRVRGA